MHKHTHSHTRRPGEHEIYINTHTHTHTHTHRHTHTYTRTRRPGEGFQNVRGRSLLMCAACDMCRSLSSTLLKHHLFKRLPTHPQVNTSASQHTLITINPPAKRGLSLLNLHVKRDDAHFEQIPAICACLTSLRFRNLKSRHGMDKLTARCKMNGTQIDCKMPDARCTMHM